MKRPPSALVALALFSGVSTEQTRAAQRAAPEPRSALVNYAKLPLHFEANAGQTAAPVKFLARGHGYTLFLAPTESVLTLRRGAAAPSVVRVTLLGANPRPVVEGKELLAGKSNYFIGNDRRNWRTNVPQYARVQYAKVYPGVSLAYYGNQGELEYDFIVGAGADPGVIRLGINGAETVSVDADGNLRIRLEAGELVQRAPVVYQRIDGARKAVDGRFVLSTANVVGFQVGAYEKDRPLVVDPVLAYSTYLGGSGVDAAIGIATDSDGSVHVAGTTDSIDFPTAGAWQPANAGSNDVFITKLNPAGSALLYSTYLGGSNGDYGNDIALDASGNAYVTGATDSTDFPTVGPVQPANGGSFDSFVAKLSSDGSALVYSTYLGGSGGEGGGNIAVDTSGSAYVAGSTVSTDFPTVNPLQAENAGSGDIFIARLNTAGSALMYSTYLGGSGNDNALGVGVDASGNAHVTGWTDSTDFPMANPLQAENAGGADAFVSKLNAPGSILIYSTYLGGSNLEVGTGIAVDAPGNAYVTGQTWSTNFPTRRALQPRNRGNNDAYVAKLNPSGSALVYSTYLGGSGSDLPEGITVDASGHPYVTGSTSSDDFPTRDPVQANNHGGGEVFIAKLTTSAVGWSALAFSTYLGGSNSDAAYNVAVDAFGNVYVAGGTNSTDFPTVLPYQASLNGGLDALVAKIGLAEMNAVPGRTQ